MSQALTAVLAGLTLAASLPGTTRAQNQWREEVTKLVDHAGKRLRDSGFTRTDVYDGSLDHDGADSFTLPLRAGRTYALLGVCDADCKNLDLLLYGGNDQVMASDVDDDAMPVVMFTPPRDGKYRLRITMTNCEDTPCFYGVALFAK